MKRFLLTFFLAILAFVASSGMFLLKYHVIEREHYLKKVQSEINKNKRSIHILNAEWATLSDPKRIRILVDTQTTLKPVQLPQVLEWDDIDKRYERTDP